MSDKRGKGFRRNPGADSRAAPRGASARAAGGAAVVLERLADRGAGGGSVNPPGRDHPAPAVRLGASTSRWPPDPLVLAGTDEEELQLAPELIEVLVIE
jgi:hypothetical protein